MKFFSPDGGVTAGIYVYLRVIYPDPDDLQDRADQIGRILQRLARTRDVENVQQVTRVIHEAIDLLNRHILQRRDLAILRRWAERTRRAQRDLAKAIVSLEAYFKGEPPFLPSINPHRITEMRALYRLQEGVDFPAPGARLRRKGPGKPSEHVRYIHENLKRLGVKKNDRQELLEALRFTTGLK